MFAGLPFVGILIAGLAMGAPAGLSDHAKNRAEVQAQIEFAAQARHARSAAASPAKKRRPKITKGPSKPAPLTRETFTKDELASATIPGMPDARFWADSAAAFEQALPTVEGPWLALSSGGEQGAYGAGLLSGWSESGLRPDFALVTGVSTGALMAIYVFAGRKYDDQLRENYTTITAADIFEVGTTPESLVESWPLERLIAKRVTPELLADIAAQHRRGRRLFVLTTNLDAGRPVAWNMGAIAAHGGEAALKLFRRVLLASASIPGEFPPVLVEVEANGRRFHEMHVDGGTNGPLFVAPETYFWPLSGKRLPTKDLYIIVNGKLQPDFEETERTTAAILGRSIVVALSMGIRLQLALAYEAAQRSGTTFNWTAVDPRFNRQGRGAFDPEYMAALFDYGVARGRSPARFHRGAPFFEQW